MGGGGVKVRIRRSFGQYKQGQEFDWGDGVARIYLARGLVEAVETAAVEQCTERATIEQRPQKRKIK